MGELWVADAIRSSKMETYLRLGIEQTDLSSTDPYNGWYLTTPTNLPELTTFLPWTPSNPTTNKRTISVTNSYPKSFAVVDSATEQAYLCQYDGPGPTTTTTTTTTTAATTTTWAACTSTVTPTTTIARGAVSKFNHYRFGYFTNTCYWLSRSTVSLSKCLNMCHENGLCFGFSYNSANSDCQLLAIIASASPYWSELTADRQYETVIRELE
uniref:Apple domain-containing protein n=1 Tax=Plectus sambesii TaxID=2011161 RepID=A0A914XCZ9_9BILA